MEMKKKGSSKSRSRRDIYDHYEYYGEIREKKKGPLLSDSQDESFAFRKSLQNNKSNLLTGVQEIPSRKSK